MTVGKTLARMAALIACAAGLSACISLLPKSKPAQLYRFDTAPIAAAAPDAVQAKPFAVLRARGGFDPAAAGDRMLTLDGQQVAYIAEARWAAPAMVLFDQALSRAFDANTGPARLVGRGQTGRAQLILQIDVREFAAVYEAGPQSAPTVVVRAHASLVRGLDRTLVSERMFESKIKTGDNRVSAIAAGFEKAVGDVLGQVIAWTNASGGSA